MKNIVMFAMVALIGLGAYSQAANSQYDIHARTIDINQKSLAFGLTEAQFEAIKDEAYVNADFVLGNIYQGDQLIKTDVPMRFNAYADEFEIKKKLTDESYSALVKDPNIFVKMGSDVYMLVPLHGSNEDGGYFNVLHDGDTYDLYKKTKATFKEGVKAKTSYARDTPPSFEKNTTYYLVQDGRFLELPSSKRKILRVMDSKKSEMKAFIKENRLDLGKERDLIKAISYFDSIL